MSGFFVNKGNIPVVFKWLADVSFLGYGVEVAVANELKGLTLTCTAEEIAEQACITSGDVWLSRLDMGDADIPMLLVRRTVWCCPAASGVLKPARPRCCYDSRAVSSCCVQFWIFIQSLVYRAVAFFALHFLYTGQPFSFRLKSLR